MAYKIQIRNGTAAEWSAANPILAQGEMGVEIDTLQYKIGNGTSTWSALSYGLVTGTMPITKGGTGATTAAQALINLGITATAAELNKLDEVTTTAAELNFVNGVTSNIQTQLNARAPLTSPALVTPTVSGSGRIISNDTAAGTSVFEIWSGTQAQYDAIGTKDANTLYFIG